MKKFYILTAAVIATGSLLCASAAEAESLPLKGTIKKAAVTRVDESQWRHLGTGKFSDPVLCNEFYGYYNDEVEVEVYESTTESNVYRIEKPWVASADGLNFDDSRNYMVIDVTDPDFVCVREGILPVASAEDGEVHYKSMTQFIWDLVKERMLPDGTHAEVTAKAKEVFMNGNMPNLCIYMKDGYIKFPQNCFGVMYPNGVNEEPGVWFPTSGHYSGYFSLPGGDVESEWVLRGTGRIFDGFIAPIFGEKAEERDVQIYEHKDFVDVFRIEDAIRVKEGVFSPITVDAVDHDYVRIPEVDTRIVTQDRGPLSIFSLSTQYEDYDSMVAAGENENKDYAARNITYSDGVIDIPAKSIYLYFPAFGFEMFVHEAAVRSFITIPSGSSSVEGVEIMEEAAPEYFDLQGTRLLEPAKGQLVIERRGGKARKVVVR